MFLSYLTDLGIFCAQKKPILLDWLFLANRRSLSEFERIPRAFLYWFLETSLQHDAIEELMDDWKSGAFFIGSDDETE